MLKNLPRYDCLLEATRSFPEMDPSAVEAFLHLLRAGDEAARFTEAHFSACNLSRGRFTVLMLLMDKKKNEPSPQTPAALADKAGVTRATMTGLIDTLERDGLVRREHDTGDRRMMLVTLTAKGFDFVGSILPEHFRRTSHLMASLSLEERKTLVRLLNKVAEQASAQPSDATALTPHLASL